MTEFIFPLRVYIEDTDILGMVFHANYLKYFERARSEWAEHVGMGIDWQRKEGVYFPVRSIKIDYFRPAQLHQMVEVVTRLIKVRPASMLYEQHLRPKDLNDTILCKAEVKIACVDLDLRPCPLPDSILQSYMENERDS